MRVVPVALLLFVTAILHPSSQALGTEPGASSADDPKQATLPSLRDELLAMFEADQAAQQAAIHGPDRETAQERMMELNDRHLARMKSIIDERGWPTFDMVGEDGARAAWLLVQHADADPDFQERSLALMEEAYRNGQASAKDFAYLTDRVRVARGRPQVYGTQFRQVDGYTVLAPVEDPESLDERRAAMGLPTLDEYYQMMRETYPGVKLKPPHP